VDLPERALQVAVDLPERALQIAVDDRRLVGTTRNPIVFDRTKNMAKTIPFAVQA